MTIRENLLAAIAAVSTTPDEQIDLLEFESHCGTVHCTLGLLCTLPRFIEQGLTLGKTRRGAAIPKLPGVEDAFSDTWNDGLNKLFGADAYARLFERSGGGLWDAEMNEPSDDKALAITRLNKQLGLYP